MNWEIIFLKMELYDMSKRTHLKTTKNHLDSFVKKNDDKQSRFLDGDWKIPSWFDKNGNFHPNDFDPWAPYKIKWKTFRLKSNPTLDIEDPFDLDNLRFINKNVVINSLEKMENLARSNDKNLVCMIWTWWTISMVFWTDWKLYPTLSPDYLLKYAWWWIEENFWVVSFEFNPKIDSSQMELDYIADIVIAMSWFYSNLSWDTRKKFCGFSVTFWTDTLSTSSTYANMMLWANCPFSVWFVASQETVLSRFSDVWTNIKNCLNILLELKSLNKTTVFICIWWTSWWAYNPALTIKTSDSSVDAFSSPWRAKIMDMSNIANRWIDSTFMDCNKNQMSIYDVFQPIIFRWFVNVSVLYANIWINPLKLYDWVLFVKNFAIILVTYGSFTFSKKQINALVESSKKANSMLLAINPFPTGSVDHLYADAVYLREQWILPIQYLQHVVYAKIKWWQTVWWNDIDKIKKFLIWNNFMWEQPNGWDKFIKKDEHWTITDLYDIRRIGQPMDSFAKI